MLEDHFKATLRVFTVFNISLETNRPGNIPTIHTRLLLDYKPINYLKRTDKPTLFVLQCRVISMKMNGPVNGLQCNHMADQSEPGSNNVRV